MDIENEDAFHLTAVDVRRYDFGTAMRGYDRVRVDQFRDQVAEELERLTRLSNDLDAKTRSMAEQLKVFRERDKALEQRHHCIVKHGALDDERRLLTCEQ